MVGMGNYGDWISRNLGVEANRAQELCLATLCSIDAIYNLHIGGEPVIELLPSGIRVSYIGSLSTFDDEKLTDLVIAAHRNRVRVQISPGMVEQDYEGDLLETCCLNIFLFARGKEGDIYSRHPGMERFTENNQA